MDSNISDDRNKGRQLILCVSKDLMGEVAIIIDENHAFDDALKSVRALLVPKIPHLQLRYDAKMRKQAVGESFRQFVAKVKTAFADVKYTPGRDTTEEVMKDVVLTTVNTLVTSVKKRKHSAAPASASVLHARTIQVRRVCSVRRDCRVSMSVRAFSSRVVP